MTTNILQSIQWKHIHNTIIVFCIDCMTQNLSSNVHCKINWNRAADNISKTIRYVVIKNRVFYGGLSIMNFLW